ncbi:MAG: hypothetical protein QOE90_1407 [Thermoplasmata archaeon]|jgi:hypothetical protein|nr:hypothetical protein [Thermoplasmata archaeon]
MRALLAAILLLSPLAAGDDALFAHRYVFEGRLVGADGLPMPGRPVAFTTDGAGGFTHACGPQQDVTDGNGDFRFCFEQGALDATKHVGVVVDGIAVTKPMDTAFRRTVVLVRDPNGTGVAPPAWNETFRVAGRALHPDERVVEGVTVFNAPLPNVTVNLTLATSGENGSVLQVRTDELGDFDATVRLLHGTRPEDVRLTVEALGQPRPAVLDPTFHRSTVGLALRLPSEPAVALDLPGTASAPPSPLLVIAAVAALVATIAWARRKPS